MLKQPNGYFILLSLFLRFQGKPIPFSDTYFENSNAYFNEDVSRIEQLYYLNNHHLKWKNKM